MPDFDAVFVGSGFGAAVTACRLVDLFPKSCLLERGRDYRLLDFPRIKLPEYVTQEPALQTSQRLPDVARLAWALDQGLFDVRNLGPLRVVQAAGLGGGSLIYANVQLRPPKEIFESWPKIYQTEMDAHFETVVGMLRAKPWPHDKLHDIPKAQLMKRAAETLGRGESDAKGSAGFFYPPLAIDATKCTRCGNCTIGCQEGAKNTLDHTYLAKAIENAKQAGTEFEIRTLCEVMYLESDGIEYRVYYYDHLTRTNRELTTKHVFLGAGAVGTTEILMRSRKRLRPHHEGWGECGGLKDLGKQFFANGDNLGVVFDTNEYAAPSQGPTITTTVLHIEQQPVAIPGHEANDMPAWFLLQDGGVPANLDPVLGFFRSPRWFWRNSLTESRRPDRSWLRPPKELGDRLVADFEAAAGDFANVLRTRRKKVESSISEFPKEWIQFLPESAREVGARIKRASETAIAEVRRFDDRVLEKVNRDTWYLTNLVVDRKRLLERISDVVAELYPPLRRLLQPDKGMEAVIDIVKFLALGKPPTQRTMVLLAMGPDAAGRLELDQRERLSVKWTDDAPMAKLYALQERLMRDFAVELGGELRTNPDWALGRRAVSVHAQGGCPMIATSEAQQRIQQPVGHKAGVTDETGQVLGFDNLYVVDAAAFPRSVGANPSCTIAAVAELKAALFRKRFKPERSDPEPRVNAAHDRGTVRELFIGNPAPAGIRSGAIAITWTEELHGWIVDATPEQRLQDIAEQWAASAKSESLDAFLALERRVDFQPDRLKIELDIVLRDFEVFAHAFETGHPLPKAKFSGVLSRTPVNGGPTTYSHTKGTISFDRRDQSSRELRSMTYELLGPLRLTGIKLFHNDPGNDLWADLTTLFVAQVKHDTVRSAGVIRINTRDFVTVQLPSYRACSLREHSHAVLEAKELRAKEPVNRRIQALKLHDNYLTERYNSHDVTKDTYAPSSAARAWALARLSRIFYDALVNEYSR